jgi:hypothetical protein
MRVFVAGGTGAIGATTAASSPSLPTSTPEHAAARPPAVLSIAAGLPAVCYPAAGWIVICAVDVAGSAGYGATIAAR